MLKVLINRLKYGLGQSTPQLFPLQVNVAIIPATEVDTLKRTGSPRSRIRKWLYTSVTVRFDYQRLTRWQLLDFTNVYFQRGLYRRPLTSCHNNFFIFIVICRPDTIGVSYHKRISMPQQPRHHIPAVKLATGAAQQPL